MFSTLETIVGLLLALLGIVGTVYYGRKANSLAREKTRFSWSDVERGCLALGRAIHRTAKPELFVCFSGPSGIVANLILEQLNYFAPLYTILIEKPGQNRIPSGLPGWKTISTTRWTLHIPTALLDSAPRRLCVIFDTVITGDSVVALNQVLVEGGFRKKEIWTCTLICSRIAELGKKAPDKCQYVVDAPVFYLPWGEGY